MVGQAVPPQSVEAQGGADFHLQCGEDLPPEQGDARRRLWPRIDPMLEQAPGRTCGPMGRGAHAGAGLLAGLVTPWGTHAGTVCFWWTTLHGRDPCWSSSWRTAPCGKDSRCSSSSGTVSHGRDPTLEQWQRVRSSPLRRKEWQRCVMNWPQPPFPIPLHHSGGGGREFGSEFKPGKKEGVGGRCF